MFWPMHYLILAFVKWLEIISHTDLQHTNCVSFIKNFIIRLLFHSLSLSLPILSFFAIPLLAKNQALLCVSNENKKWMKIPKLFKWKGSLRTTFKKHWVLIFRMRWRNYMKKHSTTKWNGRRLVAFFFHFTHSSRNDHILLLPFNWKRTKQKEKEKKTFAGKLLS